MQLNLNVKHENIGFLMPKPMYYQVRTVHRPWRYITMLWGTMRGPFPTSEISYVSDQKRRLRKYLWKWGKTCPTHLGVFFLDGV